MSEYERGRSLIPMRAACSHVVDCNASMHGRGKGNLEHLNTVPILDAKSGVVQTLVQDWWHLFVLLSLPFTRFFATCQSEVLVVRHVISYCVCVSRKFEECYHSLAPLSSIAKVQSGRDRIHQQKLVKILAKMVIHTIEMEENFPHREMASQGCGKGYLRLSNEQQRSIWSMKIDRWKLRSGQKFR
ncbi:hypothetical protein BT69DRAFT_158622 [Atractiella rhizophila]|nr:hypothetical protein BT69DRAFT_158622 [Atractiella rhizophila]